MQDLVVIWLHMVLLSWNHHLLVSLKKQAPMAVSPPSTTATAAETYRQFHNLHIHSLLSSLTISNIRRLFSGHLSCFVETMSLTTYSDKTKRSTKKNQHTSHLKSWTKSRRKLSKATSIHLVIQLALCLFNQLGIWVFVLRQVVHGWNSQAELDQVPLKELALTLRQQMLNW